MAEKENKKSLEEILNVAQALNQTQQINDSLTKGDSTERQEARYFLKEINGMDPIGNYSEEHYARWYETYKNLTNETAKKTWKKHGREAVGALSKSGLEDMAINLKPIKAKGDDIKAKLHNKAYEQHQQYAQITSLISQVSSQQITETDFLNTISEMYGKYTAEKLKDSGLDDKQIKRAVNTARATVYEAPGREIAIKLAGIIAKRFEETFNDRYSKAEYAQQTINNSDSYVDGIGQISAVRKYEEEKAKKKDKKK